MSKKTINFDNKKINKSSLKLIKDYFIIDDIKRNLWKKGSFKYFIAYRYLDYIGPLCIKFPQIFGYVKCFEINKTMSFRVTDNNILEKYTEIRRRVSNLKNIEFDSEPIYRDINKYIKTKIKNV